MNNEGFEKLVNEVHRVAVDVKMNAVQRARVKENVFERLQRPAESFSFWNPLRRFVGAVLAVVIFFGGFVYLKPTSNFVSASEISYINSLNGEVWIFRDGEKLMPKIGFELKPGDEVLTADNALVEIYFFDDSRSQLAGGSRLIIDELVEIEEETEPGSYVKVSLIDGRVWTKVVDLPEQSAFVIEAEGKIVETDRAAFDVQVKDKKVSVGVFNSSVAVKDDGKVEKILSGQKIVFEDEKSLKQVISNDDRALAWVKTNLAVDQSYLLDVERNLIAAKIEAIGEEFSETDELVLLGYDDVAKQKEAFVQAENRLASLQYDLSMGKGSEEDLAKAIVVFKAEVQNFYNLIEEVRYTDVKYADSLRSFVDGRILSYQGDLAATLPTSSAYPVKEAINGLVVQTETDPVKALELKVSQVEQAISDVEAVKDVVDQSTLNEVTNNYVEEVKTVMEEINTLKVTDPNLAEKLKVDLIEDFSVIDSVNDPYELKVIDGKVLPPQL